MATSTARGVLRVLFVAESLAKGGAENQIALLANGLAERGHRVEILLLTEILSAYSLDSRIRIRRSGFARTQVQTLAEIREAARDGAPPVVVPFLPVPVTWCRLGRIFDSGAPVVSSIRSIRYRPYPVWKALERALGRMDTLTVVNSHATERFLLRLSKKAEDRLRVVRNAVDPDRFHPPRDWGRRAREVLGIPPGDRVYVMLASLQHVKGHNRVLKALGYLKKDGALPKNLRLFLVGGERQQGYRDRIEAEIRRRGLETNVVPVGETESPETWLQAAEGLVLASRWEGSPNVILEAMASGLPWVATPVSDLPDIAKESRAGIALPSHSKGVLAEGIRMMLEMHGEKRRRMGARGREWVLKNATPRIAVERFEVVLREARKKALKAAGKGV